MPFFAAAKIEYFREKRWVLGKFFFTFFGPYKSKKPRVFCLSLF